MLLGQVFVEPDEGELADVWGEAVSFSVVVPGEVVWGVEEFVDG